MSKHSKRRRGAPGLLTREERYKLRLARDDLTRRIEQGQEEGLEEGEASWEELQDQLDNVERERREDRASRPRKRGKQNG